jgi:hypothetical protein
LFHRHDTGGVMTAGRNMGERREESKGKKELKNREMKVF